MYTITREFQNVFGSCSSCCRRKAFQQRLKEQLLIFTFKSSIFLCFGTFFLKELQACEYVCPLKVHGQAGHGLDFLGVH